MIRPDLAPKFIDQILCNKSEWRHRLLVLVDLRIVIDRNYLCANIFEFLPICPYIVQAIFLGLAGKREQLLQVIQLHPFHFQILRE